MPYKTDATILNEMYAKGISINDAALDAVQKFRVSTPQTLIDTDFEYSLQGTKWEVLNLNNNIPSVFARANEPAYTAEQVLSIIPSPSGSRDVMVTVGVEPDIQFKVGNPIVLKETSDTTYVDGAYVIKAVSGTRSFIVTTKSPAPLSGQFKTPYTTIYTGDFFTNSELLINGISAVDGTKFAKIEFSEPHSLFLDSPITVIDRSQNNSSFIGSFIVNGVISDCCVTYETNSDINFTNNNSLVNPLSTKVYARGEGVAIHRFFDGGVQINPGTAAPNAQIIRQTRKYFRYQSGKSMQFSTGVLFKPVYEVTNAYTLSSSYDPNAYPFYDFYVTTEQYHGFSPVDEYRLGAVVALKGFEVLDGTNPYNREYEVAEVINAKTFKIKIPVSEYNRFPTSDFNPGGIAEVEVVGWNDASVRSGMFDDQNGLFFECDGDELVVVRRYSTTPTSGTISAKTGKKIITSTDGNTKFLSQFKENDYVVIKGQSYMMSNIVNNLSAYVVPAYRGPNIDNVKIYKTLEERYSQKEFNLDRLDGTGPSGYVVDLSKMQMMFVDYSWYGAGKVRFGLRANDGKIIYFHEIYNNNKNRKAYMRSGNLPGRFEIQSKSKTGTLMTSVLTDSVSAIISKKDADQIPDKGRIIINNEYIKYTKTGVEDGGVVLYFNERNSGGLETGPVSAAAGDGFISYNQNCSPALSHWGVSVIMDGRFDEDKSYLFTATTSTQFSATSAEQAILSVRLAPSVDYGIAGPFGVRSLVNRSLLTLKNIGVVVTQPVQVIVRNNTEHPIFYNESYWQQAGNGSISQFLDHTIYGSFDATGTGGDVIASYYIVPGVSVGSSESIFGSESFDVNIVRELGNSILGGNGTYPDGPDTLTVFVKTFDSIPSLTRARVSWTEAQG